jgi:hypothetical protein
MQNAKSGWGIHCKEVCIRNPNCVWDPNIGCWPPCTDAPYVYPNSASCGECWSADNPCCNDFRSCDNCVRKLKGSTCPNAILVGR